MDWPDEDTIPVPDCYGDIVEMTAGDGVLWIEFELAILGFPVVLEAAGKEAGDA